MKHILVFFTLLTLTFQAVAETSEKWTFEVTPYLWAANIESKIKAGEFVASGGLDFGELIDVLDMALMGQFEARKGQWSLFSDIVYFDLADKSNPSSGTQLDANLTQTVAFAMIGYKPAMFKILDLYAGLRYDKVEVDLDFSGVINNRDISRDIYWVDPVIGLRVRYPLGKKLAVDMNGFVSTGHADYTGLFSLGMRYQFTDHWSSSLSYRYSDIDYNDDHSFKETSTGAMLSVGYKF